MGLAVIQFEWPFFLLFIKHSLTGKFIGHGFQLTIPVFTETANERLAKKTVEREAKPTAEGNGIATDVPAMIIEADEVANTALPDRVKMARNGAARQQAALGTAEHTVAATNNARHQFSLRVGISHAIAVNLMLRAG